VKLNTNLPILSSAHIELPGSSLSSPICVVSTVDILTATGWTDIANFTRFDNHKRNLNEEEERRFFSIIELTTFNKIHYLMLSKLNCWMSTN
jgi:hypothetical protein